MKRPYGIPRPHNDRDALQRVWQAMRILRRFTIPQLQATAGENGQSVHYVHVHRYLAALRRCGYMFLVRPYGGRPGEHAVFRLALDSGPLRPLVRQGMLFDPNWRIWFENEKTFTPRGEVITNIRDYLRTKEVANG